MIETLVRIGTKTLEDQLGVPGSQAREVMRELVHQFAVEEGGFLFYLPKDAAWKVEQRDLQILERINRGSTAIDVARDFGISERQVHSVVRHLRDRRPKQQNDLPGIDPAGLTQ